MSYGLFLFFVGFSCGRWYHALPYDGMWLHFFPQNPLLYSDSSPHTHTNARAFFFPISIRETRRKKCIGALFDFHTLSHQRGYLQLFFSDWDIVTGLCLVLSLWPFLSNRIISSRAHVDISEETRRGVPFDKHTHTRGLWRHTHTHTKQQPGPRHHDEWNSHFSPLPPLRYCDHHDICLIL